MRKCPPIICDDPRISGFSKPDVAHHILQRFYRNSGDKNAMYLSVYLCSAGDMEYCFPRIGVYGRIINIFVFLPLHNGGKKICICCRSFSASIFITASVFIHVHYRRKKRSAGTYMVSQSFDNQTIIS